MSCSSNPNGEIIHRAYFRPCRLANLVLLSASARGNFVVDAFVAATPPQDISKAVRAPHNILDRQTHAAGRELNRRRGIPSTRTKNMLPIKIPPGATTGPARASTFPYAIASRRKSFGVRTRCKLAHGKRAFPANSNPLYPEHRLVASGRDLRVFQNTTTAKVRIPGGNVTEPKSACWRSTTKVYGIETKR